MKKKTTIMILLAIFLALDVCFYIATPYDFRIKQPFLYRLLPGSGVYFFVKNKISE